ncbi:MAG TPA: outer membrane beta-barrel protein [Vicinamibacteria bacterium]|nr:outer membrane beta-barrel protein [Vicinamibacteria bacterium]
MRPAVATALLTLLPSAALAQRVELTPLAGYRFGGSLTLVDTVDGVDQYRELEVADHAAWGAQIAVRVSSDSEAEVLYARQDTRLQTSGLFTGQPVFGLALETWQFGGNYLFGEESQRVRPYLGVGLGLTRLLPKAEGLQDETRFSASFAGGVKLWLARNLGLRFEARGFLTVLESDRETFCTSPGTCHVDTHAADIFQAELRGGVVLRF